TLSKEACAEISHNDMMSGGFTIEKLAEASKLSRISVDADALPDVYTSLYFSEGGYYTSDNKTLSYSSFANDIVSNISALRKSFSTDYSDGQDKTSGFDVFSHGNSLFAISTLDRAAELGTCGFMWDFFPLPKLDDSQDDYVSVMSFDAPVMTVSTFTNNIDAMSYTMNGLNAASYGFIAQEYGEYLQNNFVTSSQTLDSFDLIYSLSVKYDTAVMFRSVSSVKAATEDSLESSILTGSAFVSESKKYMSKYNSALKGLN
ncbi:MAG: hypothetical protein J5850_02470, partial [Clostridia bacterium]|nr:hypothetical protein [Clostridia bacterium]